MPANLPPNYFEAEKRFREAKTPQEKIAILEEMLAIVPKHKGTDKLRADLRRRLSKLNQLAQQKKKTGRKGPSYYIPRDGAGQVVILGPTNVGKSSLLSSLTKAKPDIADYPYTTRIPIPGMMPYKNTKVQLIDLPALSNEFTPGWVKDLIRRADAALIVVDMADAPLTQLETTITYLENNRFTLLFKEADHDPSEYNPTILKALLVANKMDIHEAQENLPIFKELMEIDTEIYPISTKTGEGLEVLRPKIYEILKVIRVYTKTPGKEPDLSSPFILPEGSSVEDLAYEIHKDIAKGLKFAKVWGKKTFPGQRVQRDYELNDGDIVELHA